MTARRLLHRVTCYTKLMHWWQHVFLSWMEWSYFLMAPWDPASQMQLFTNAARSHGFKNFLEWTMAVQPLAGATPDKVIFNCMKKLSFCYHSSYLWDLNDAKCVLFPCDNQAVANVCSGGSRVSERGKCTLGYWQCEVTKQKSDRPIN